jgi:SsrA-binding protein
MADYAYNRKAKFDYEFGDDFEAGIELLGIEVKSVRSKQASLEGSHVIIRGDEAFLMNVNIPPYQPGNTPADYDAFRTRKLILTKKEIDKLADVEKQKGLTIIPISMYNKGRKIKIKLVVGKGKKRYDKRQTIKKRESDREIAREYKGRR